MADGFLGRWSRRKLDAESGKPVEPEPAKPVIAAQAAIHAPVANPVTATAETAAPVAEQKPAPTMEDVAALTPESDYSAFAARGVDPQVKNAAMKKLFTDPHYNIMDRMDVYIDDYSKPDPIPEAWLRNMVAGKFLGLFKEEEEKEEAEKKAKENADGPPPEDVAQSEHADPDLRLQQDHAPPGKDPGTGTQ